MTASVIYLQHCLTPQKRRIEHVAPRSIRSLAPDWQRPHIALLDGQAILRADWGRTLHHGETLAFVDVETIPQGGGGKSNPLQMVLMLAVMVTAGPLAAQMLGPGGTIMGMSAAASLTATTFAIQMAGMMLINALIPPPKMTSAQQAAALAAPSPTYSMQAQGNSARLEAAIPEHFGRHIAYPDFAAQPYQEYAGNEQYLFQLFCVGRGEYEIESIRIEDTPITSFDEIETEIIGPGELLTLFPSNVVSATEVAGQELTCIDGTYGRTGNTVTVAATGHGLTTGNAVYLNFTSGGALDDTYTVITAADADHFTVATVASGTISSASTCTVSRWIGPYIVNASETVANYLGVDYIMPRGMYHANATTGALENVSVSAAVEIREVDDDGLPIGSWTAFASNTYEAATTTPQRYSVRGAVAEARYQVRARRVDVEETDSAYGHNLVWGGLRAYLPETRTFGDVTLLAMRMRASNNLSMQASRKVNVIATRMIPVWDGSTWSANQTTRSIAWAFVYACKQVGLADAQIDLATLYQLDQTWSARGDYFDARFDNFLSFWEAISKIATAGRAKAYMQAGVVRIMRDQEQSIPVQLYSMRNISRGSFSVDYLMPTPDTADAIDVAYFDSNAWMQRRVRATLPDSSAERPAKIELFGVTDRDHAYREGLYQAAANRYRRKLIKFGTEMEGFIPSFGDLIAIQHDMPAWGQSGEVVAWDSASATATLSEPVEFIGSVTHYIAFRNRDGSLSGPYSARAGTTAYEIRISRKAAANPNVSSTEERSHYAFGPSATWHQPARVIAIRPRGLTSVEIECINEDPSVHSAEEGQTAPAIQHSQLANYTNTPSILGLIIRSSSDDPTKALLTWQASPWAEYYIIEQSADGVAWTRAGETGANNYTLTTLYGSGTLIRIAAVGLAKGPWVTVAYGSSADYMWSATSSDLMWSATSTDLMWAY